jgi:hypothetical protein
MFLFYSLKCSSFCCCIWWACFSTESRHTYVFSFLSTYSSICYKQTSRRGFSRKRKEVSRVIYIHVQMYNVVLLYKSKLGDLVDHVNLMALKYSIHQIKMALFHYFYLHLEIDSEGWLRMKLYDKREDLKTQISILVHFPLVNFPCVSRCSIFIVFCGQLSFHLRSFDHFRKLYQRNTQQVTEQT